MTMIICNITDIHSRPENKRTVLPRIIFIIYFTIFVFALRRQILVLNLFVSLWRKFSIDPLSQEDIFLKKHPCSISFPLPRYNNTLTNLQSLPSRAPNLHHQCRYKFVPFFTIVVLHIS